MGTPEWLGKLFDTIDNKDADGFVAFLTEDATFTFGNADPVQGKTAIKELLIGFFGSIKAIRHEILDVWTHPDAVISRGTVTYTRHDSSTLTVPFANIFKMENNLVREYLIYVDTSQLYAGA
ncbi:MAG: nuclear transport factor 2 family protein [Chlorobi bacterium]|nr:nuclear transport factor 2 family protein [Chlorobiota bacterium]